MTKVTDLGAATASNTPTTTHPKEEAMKLNVGGMDRIARIAIGLVLIGLTLTGTIGVWGWLGIVPLATGAIGWCPPYAMLGFSTCAMKK